VPSPCRKPWRGLWGSPTLWQRHRVEQPLGGAMRIFRVLLAAALSVATGILFATTAAATPGKSPQWTLVLVGTCDGVPATVIDPPGPGPTGFSTLTGKMGVGRLFQAVNTQTGETIVFGSYGNALEHANQPIVTCDFPIPPDVSPDGSADWLFRVTGFFHS
jgi:hypothetical protein